MASTKEEAKKQFQALKEAWQSNHLKVVKSWEEDLDVLLLSWIPRLPCGVIYTTNIIERTMKEIKKRMNTMNSLHQVKR